MTRRMLRAAVGALLIALVAASCSSTPSAATFSAINTPVHTIATSDGTVQYRSVGVGPPLVMIMGFASSQDLWPPGLVDDLATHFRVITFNNAGIGDTSPLPSPLTISAMADQTAAFISAMKLSRPDVFGWSMGGMIAQALVARHPQLVDRLVLGATSPGTGQAVPSHALASFVANTEAANSAAVLKGLFPPSSVATEGPAFVAAVKSYPNFTSASVAIDQAQWAAIKGWDAGDEPAGHTPIHVATLIGDGADDVLIPPSNAHLLHSSIPGSILVLYPGAGHAFVYQDAAAWSAAMTKFLG